MSYSCKSKPDDRCPMTVDPRRLQTYRRETGLMVEPAREANHDDGGTSQARRRGKLSFIGGKFYRLTCRKIYITRRADHDISQRPPPPSLRSGGGDPGRTQTSFRLPQEILSTPPSPPSPSSTHAYGHRSSVIGHRSSNSAPRLTVILLCLLILSPAQPLEGADSFTIKFATLAPEGSTWMLTLREMDAELQQRSNGRIRFVFYPGGVLGDEIDVIRKIRIGQVHGGAFSGVGLGSVLPSVRVLELPLLFEGPDEADFVTGQLEDYFARAFTEKGFIFLTFAEAGPVHFFSQKPIRRRRDLQGVKMWVWYGDPLAAALFRTYQVAPIPLALPDVFPSLQTGLIDAFYAPPLAAIALQWFSQVSYMSSQGLTRAIGGMLISRSRWETIPADLQMTLKDVANKYARQVVVKTRRENQEALTVLQQNGIQIVNFEPEERRHLLEVSHRVWEEQAGRLYPRSLLDQVKSFLQQYGGKGP